MSRRRRWVVGLVVAVTTLGSLYDMVTDTEHWPFSNYRMYQRISWRQHEVSRMVMVGVTAGGEVPLVGNVYFEPLFDFRLTEGIRQVLGRRGGEALAEEAMLGALRLYEASRRRGEHDGPPLLGLRLERRVWKPEPWARNTDRPDQVLLLHEVQADDP